MINKKDMSGVFHPIMAVVIVAVVAVIGFAGWRVMEKSNDGGDDKSSAQSNNALESKCNSELKDKDLCKFVSRADQKISLKTTTTVKGLPIGTDGTNVSTLEIDGKDNYSLTTAQDGKEESVSILLNGDSYVKDVVSGKWTKYPKDPNTTVTPPNDASNLNFLNTKDLSNGNKKTYKALGKEACGKLTCFKYQIVDSENPEVELFIWFDTKDYRLQRVTTKQDSVGSSDTLFSYQPVNIKAPSPVEEVPVDNSEVIEGEPF